MAEDLLLETKIKHSGIFKFKDFYSFIFDLLKDDLGYTVAEKSYTEKIKADGKEIEVKWEATKTVTDYFKFKIKVNIRILGMNETEVNKNGKKEKVNSGDLEVKISAFLMKDYEGRFDVTPFHKFLKGVYERYLIKKQIEQMEDKLVDETLKVINETKAYLALEIS